MDELMLSFLRGKERLRSIQVEISTACQLNCEMCPKNLFSSRWISALMDFDLYRTISEDMNMFRYVHLQGWGEPLLNPNICDMITIAKRKRCSVGVTTNGLLLDREMCSDLIKAGVDLIAVSVAGARPETHDLIRKGSSLEDLKQKLKDLSSVRKVEKRPKITLTTIMMKNTVHELPDLVNLAREVGADELIVNNLDYIPSPDLGGMEVFSPPGLEPEKHILESIERAKLLADKLGVRLYVRPLKMEESVVCAESPLTNVFVTYQGDVAPCVYLHLPTKERVIPRFFMGAGYLVEKLYFGRVDSERLRDVWKKEIYRDFRDIFYRRAMAQMYPSSFPGKIEIPEQCRTCYKMYSI